MLNFTAMGMSTPSRPPVVCIHSQAPRELDVRVLGWLTSCASAMNATTAATKLMPTAARVIRRTAASPSRLPQIPFTKAPHSGRPRMTAMRA
jgi:hypothetical protein